MTDSPRSRLVAGAIVVGALGAVVGLILSWVLPTRYTSTATVLVTPIGPDPVESLSADATEVDLETEVVVAGSRRVATLANELLDDQPPAGSREPEGTIDVEGVRNTRAIRISFTADTPENAQRGASAYASAYVAVREDILLNQLNAATARLEARAGELTEEIASLERQGPSSAAEPEIEALAEERSEVQRSLADLRNAGTDVATIIDPAELPDSASSMTARALAASGAALGLALGAAVALTLDALAMRSGAATNTDPGAATQQPTLGSGPRTPSLARAPDSQSRRVPGPTRPLEPAASAVPEPRGFASATEDPGPAGPARATTKAHGARRAAPKGEPASKQARSRVSVDDAAPAHQAPDHPSRHGSTDVPGGRGDTPDPTGLPGLSNLFEQVNRSGAQFMPSLMKRVAHGNDLLIVVDDDHQSSGPLGLAIGRELALHGVETIVIEVAAIGPSLTDLTGVDASPGFTDMVMAGPATLRGREVGGIPGMRVLPIGPSQPQLTESMVSAAIRSLNSSDGAVVVVAGRASWTPLFDMEVGPSAVMVATRKAADPGALAPEDRAAIRRVRSQLLGIISLGRSPVLV